MEQRIDFIINEHASIKDALKVLNETHSRSMTLFVVNNEDIMVGTVTDGDIRRSLIGGARLDDGITNAMHRDFERITDKEDIRKVRELREREITLIPYLDSDGRIIEIFDLTHHRSILPVDAVLMAGGKGERLRPLTLTTPKPLLKIGEETIIDRNIRTLTEYGIKKVNVTVNYLKEQLKDHFNSISFNGVKADCVEEEEFFGTIGSLKLIKEFENDTILVMNSDILTNIDYEDFYLHFKEHDAMMSAAAIPYTISVPYGIFELSGRNITGVSEKPVYNLYANAGIYLIKKEALEYIPENKVFNATDLIDVLAQSGKRVIRYPLSGLWIDIGTPEEYNKARELIKHLIY